jgi:hypothetical protein
MNDRTSRFAFVAACTVAPLAVIGSAFSLYRIAEGAGLALPVALPVALDFTALAAAAQIRARRHLALAWVTLVAGVLGSAALQVADAWALGPIAWGVHGALPLAALVCFEFTVPDKADNQDPPAGAKSPPKLASKPPAPAPAEVPAPPLGPPPARKAPERPAAARVKVPSLELVEGARRIADGLGVPAWELTRRQLQDGLKALDPPVGIGTAKAGQVLDLLKQARAAELQIRRVAGSRPADLEVVR